MPTLGMFILQRAAFTYGLVVSTEAKIWDNALLSGTSVEIIREFIIWNDLQIKLFQTVCVNNVENI